MVAWQSVAAVCCLHQTEPECVCSCAAIAVVAFAVALKQLNIQDAIICTHVWAQAADVDTGMHSIMLHVRCISIGYTTRVLLIKFVGACDRVVAT